MGSISSDFMLMLILLIKWLSVSIKIIRYNAQCFLCVMRAMLMAAMVSFSHLTEAIKCSHSCGRTAGFMMIVTATPVSAAFCFSSCNCTLNAKFNKTKQYFTIYSYYSHNNILGYLPHTFLQM